MEGKRLIEKEYKKNCDFRWEILKEKSATRYKESWREYPIGLLIDLGLHRLEEVKRAFESTGRFDRDNWADGMNFCDFVLAKMLGREEDGVMR